MFWFLDLGFDVLQVVIFVVCLVTLVVLGCAGVGCLLVLFLLVWCLRLFYCWFDVDCCLNLLNSVVH